MAKALGADAATEPAPNTHLLNPYLAGDVGLLFTARSPEDVLSYFSTFHPQDFARAGFRAPRGFSLQPGILYSNPETLMPEEDVPLAHTQDPILRKLNVPTRVVKGKVVLGEEGGEPHVVCREGEILGSGQTTLLKMFGIQMAEFAVEVKAWWSKETGEVTVREASEMTVDA
jgi:mRNA turnover protein 4